MKILFFADNFPPERNAQASRVFERARWWVRQGHQVTVITSAPNFPEGKLFPGYRNDWRRVEMREGIRVVRVKTYLAPNRGTWRRAVDFGSFLVSAFFMATFEARPDVVAATSPQPLAGYAGWLTSLVRGCPFVLELSDLWPASMVGVGMRMPRLLYRALEGAELFLYGRADWIAPQTEAFAEDLAERGVAREKMTVVRNGVELEQYQPGPREEALASRVGIEPGDFVAGYFGTLGLAHGLEGLLAAAERLREGRVRILLMGPGAEREKLIAEVERRGLRRVTVLPACGKEEMPAFWRLLDVALVHLRDEPVFRTVVPSKIYEAMAMGLPVLLVAPAGEASRFVAECGAGCHVAAGDEKGLAGVLEEWSRNESARARYGAAGRKAAPRFSRERQASEMARVFEAARQNEAKENKDAEKKHRMRGRSAPELREVGAVGREFAEGRRAAGPGDSYRAAS